MDSRSLFLFVAGSVLPSLAMALLATYVIRSNAARGGLSWQFRLLVEFAVAAICVWLVPNLRLTAFISFPLLTEALSVLWIVVLINAFNMLDNMDGLSAGVAAIAAGILAAVMLLGP